MNKPLRFKLLTKFTSLIHSLTAQVNRRGIPARKWFVPIVSVGLFILFILNPFSSRAQFPYEETFKNSTTNKPDVKFGGEPTAFLTALRPITGSVTDKEGEGYLRLTNNTKKQKGYVYSNNVFLGTYGLNIEFEYFTYKGDTDGADGLCFFLFDAAVPDAGFNIGGFGGSLGYAQLYKDKTFFSGVSKGYLGIGLDEFGNFSNHNENRQGDKDQIPNSVTIRGAGDGSANDPSNYPLIETVKTSSLKTDAFDIGGGSRTATDGDPKYRKVLINLVPRTGGGLLISVSVKHGSVVTPVIVKFPYTTPIPAKGLKYGIASSTGDNVNYHEIRGLKLTVDENVLSQPEAPSPSMNICQRENGVLDILTGATRPNAGGEPNPDNVDLNPLTPEIDRKVITPAGTFEFDNINTKKLLYTPAPGYSGSSAAIQFTFMDVYGAKSTVGTATFNISSPIITVQPVSGTICENSNFTATVTATGGSNLSYQWEYPNSNGDWISLPDPDGKLGAQTSTLHITNAPFTYSGNQYRVKVSSPGGCIVISDIIKLTVNQLPTSKISPYQQGVCIGSPDIPITFSGENGVGPYTFSYTISDGTVTSAIKTLTTSNSSKSITINHPTNVAGVFTYEIVNVSNSTCSNVQSEWSEITIKPNPSVELVPLSGNVIQSLCVGMTMKPIVYQVKDAIKATMTLNTPNPEIKFFYDIDKKTITISGVPSTFVGKFPFTVNILGGCSPLTTTGEINILPNTTIALTSAVNTDQQQPCINTAITKIEYLVTNGKGAVVTGLPVELSGVYDPATGKFTITGTPLTAGLISYTVTASGDCEPAIIRGTVNVKPDVTIALTSAVNTAQQQPCINHAITPIEYQVTHGNTATVTGLPAELRGVYDPATGKFTITGIPLTAGLISYTVTASGDCEPAITHGTINVKPDVTIALTSAVNTAQQQPCINTPINKIEYLVANGKAAVATGLPAELRGVYDPATGKFTITGIPLTASLISYTVTASGDCEPAIIHGTINVKPDVTIALTSAVNTGQQQPCINHAISPIEYQVTHGNTAMVTGLPAEMTGVYDPATGKFTITGTPLTVGLISYTVTASGDCEPAIIHGTINVKPDVTIALTSAVNTDQQQPCINHAISPIEYQVTHGNTVTVTGLPAELRGVYDPATGKFTITGAPLAAGLISYTVIASGDCEPAITHGTINVKPDVTITLTSAVNTDQQELCINHAITQIEYLVTHGNNATITGLPAELTGVYNNTTNKFTITGTPATAGLITYTITATGDCKPANITGTITVKPNVELVLTTGSNNQSSCINTQISNTTYTVTNGTAAATNLPPGLTQNFADGLLTISGIPSQAGTFLYTVTATGNCGTKELHAQINVYPNTIMELTSPAESNEPVLCINTPLNPIVYKITNATSANTSALPSGLTGNYNPDTKEFTVSGTPSISGAFPYTITTTGGCASVTLTGIIKVNPNTTLQLTSASSTANQTICVNSNNLQTITYQTTNATAATVTGLPTGLISKYDNNQIKISGIPTQSGTFNYTVNTTGLCQTQQLSGTIIVTPNPIGFNDVISNLTCTNNSIQYNLQDNVNNTINGGNSIPSVFLWTVAPNNNVKGLNSGSGNNINATLINTSHTPQQVIYTVTPTSITGGCPGNTFTITVNVPVCNSLTLTKTANVTLVSTAGDQIQYTITVKNTGTANHTNVQVTDPFLGGILRGPAYGDNGNGILEANESWVYTGTYRVTQTDIDENGKPNAKSGKIINTASLTTAEMSAPLTAVATVDIVTNGSIVLVKTGVISSDFSTIIYTFKITNNGRVKLYNLNLMDTKIGGQINLGINELAAGASITVTATYKISDEEKRDGRVINSATIKGNTPAGDPVSDISGTQANNDEPTVHIIVDAPQAIDDKAEVQINQTVVINIAGNDIASLSGLDKASIEHTQTSNGKVERHNDGTITYTPNKGYSGQDEFTYYIYDHKAGTPNRSNRATVTINVIPIGLFIPNTITPNGDGKNDTFKIIGRESFDGIELMVFNRWGNEVYRNNNYLDEWDGSGLTEGTYYYVITLKKAGSKVNKNGWILIKR